MIETQPRRNWWKVAFFVALIAFEFAREIAVLASAEGARPSVTSHFFHMEGFTSAKGSWKRIDGGGSLLPTTVTIECRENTGQCIEASVTMIDQFVYAPELDWFDAQFANDTVSYENDVPDCARYSVRIDMKMEKVFAVRDRKENPTNPNCTKIERRIEMQLGNSSDTWNKSREGHFVPLISAIAAIIEVF